MNVRKLKEDIWKHLDFSLLDSITKTVDEENKNPNTTVIASKKQHQPQSKLNFRDMLSDMSAVQTQKDVSLSFYFICLLHLANEKVNEIHINSIILCLNNFLFFDRL